MSLLLFLPAFIGDAQVAPGEVGGNNVTPNAIYDYDGNTIEILEQDPQKTTILLNGTYELKLEHNATNVGVLCTKLDLGGTTVEADEMLFDVNFETDPTDGQTLDVTVPGMSFELSSGGPNNDEWNASIIGAEAMALSYNTTDGDFWWSDGYHEIELESGVLQIDGAMMLNRINETAWDIFTPTGLVVANFNPGAGYMGLEYFGPVYYGAPPGVPVPPFYIDAVISIGWDGNSVTIGGIGYSILISAYTLILIWDYIIITWYFAYLFIERIVFVIWDITIIIYLTIIELLIVIIYYTYEIKIYETSIVIVYMFIEIIFLFISITIWELTFIFHFEFWFIEIITIIDITVNIIVQPIRFVFIPIIVPVFIPVIFFVPVLLIQYIHVYVPYASPALHIDVVDEDLAMPTHTIQYLVYDEANTPIVDAAVNVNYDGSDYPAAHIGGGVYEVDLPASNVVENIIVTATKSWYPDAVLDYDLGIDWIIDTITLPPTTVNNTVTTTVQAGIIFTSVILTTIIGITVAAVIYRKRRN
jgi:hypothetical protein